ncbi:MAG: 50S ribosomal protein L25 [Puniceicoccaceae bacterium]|nr:MAG: 50S ribosomal protein L25 [Puniceicoccaceae bacterium]
MKQLKLTVLDREGSGRGISRRLRASGRIPAILYGKISQPQSLAIDAKEIGLLLKEVGDSTAIIEIEQDGREPRLSVLQEVQRDPMTDRILHVDLHEVSASEKINVSVAVHTKGEAVGVKIDGGVLEIVAHEIQVRCLPKDLPSHIEVDVSSLRVGHTIHIGELPAIEGVEVLDDEEQPVVSCVASEVEEEEAAEEGAPAATAPAAAAEPAEK